MNMYHVNFLVAPVRPNRLAMTTVQRAPMRLSTQTNDFLLVMNAFAIPPRDCRSDMNDNSILIARFWQQLATLGVMPGRMFYRAAVS